MAVVLAETTGANVIRNVHAPRAPQAGFPSVSIHGHKDAAGAWEWMVQDGLSSVRGVVDNSVGVLESRNYDPYGTGFGATGSNQTSYGFTGEPTDSNGLLHLRARYYNPAAGVFTALDPFEGTSGRPMSLNGYLYVEGNAPNAVDPSGAITSYFGSVFASPSSVNTGGCGGNIEECTQKCSGSRNQTLCINSCVLGLPYFEDSQNSIPADIDLKIKNSTVVISLGYDIGGPGQPYYGCQPPLTTHNCQRDDTSLGTLVSDGVLTHDHFAKSTSLGADSGQSLNYFINFMKYDWIRLEGANGTIYERFEIISAVTYPTQGTMLIPIIANIGSVATRQNINISPKDKVYYAYVPGSNFTLPFVEYNRIRVYRGTYRGQGVWPDPQYFHALLEDCRDENKCGTPGDSGGGFFNDKGEIIGVRRGSGFYGLINQAQSEQFTAAQ